ncbi:hypothetical protein DUNSADRAFT_11294 [Dunaliella salina]|uniref:Encoded protein n=1 Tax=Dunaliella salina TaxID=3046 RepID=A0ABQ7GDN9_DUNSA|nr:hypothetical protein DUNSADRAFT_11294 [Dunaliella salina]KAF5832713.1 hypothetical protein DUNSADRAFT_11294 [Dunaliella salina]KAF5832714.1 hypothetical protein DUNSADRAFT_11294 [Dunaliella salina]|eukprot:KAF5832712.1 hypothetical protein DUNSADRAFT_11294 [Dunaliella salina]
MLALQQQREQQLREQEEIEREQQQQQQQQQEHHRKMAFAAHPSSPARASAELRSSFREMTDEEPEAPEGYTPPPFAVTPVHQHHLDPLFHRGRLPTVAPPKLQLPFRAAHPTSSRPGAFFNDDDSLNMGARASPLGPGTFPAGACTGGHLNPSPRPVRFSPRTDAAAPLAEEGGEERVERSDRTFGLPGSLDAQLSRRTAETMAGGAYLSADCGVLPDNTASPSSQLPGEAEDGSAPPARISSPRH